MGGKDKIFFILFHGCVLLILQMFLATRLVTGGCCVLGIGAAAAFNKTSIFASNQTSRPISTSMGCSASSQADAWKSANTIYDFTAVDIAGNEVDLRVS